MSTTTKKVTKKEQYNVLLDIVSLAEENGFEISGEVTFDGLRDFISHEIELLDNKAAAAQKRAAEKKQEGDELREKVLNVLSETEAMTIDEIVEALNDPDVKRNMVISRLTQLGKLQLIEKEQVSTGKEGKTRKISAYRRVQ